MIDVGVARPSAQGQAMISTATVLSSARLNAGAGPEDEPDDERERGEDEHAGTKIAGHDVGEALDRRPGALRLRDQPDDPGERPCRAPTRVARNVSVPVVFSVAADDLVAGALGDRQALAREHALVDARGAVDDDAVDRRPSRRAARGRGRRRAPRRSGQSISTPSRTTRAVRGAQADQPPDRVRGVASGRGPPGTGRAGSGVMIAAAVSK